MNRVILLLLPSISVTPLPLFELFLCIHSYCYRRSNFVVVVVVIDDDLSGQPGNATSDMFLSKLEAITGSLAYSKHAAKSARYKMFAMIGRFGLPSILFTITPH